MKQRERKYLFDPKCLELAEHFLPTDASERLKNELAQSVQEVVEDFCEMEAAGLNPIATGAR